MALRKLLWLAAVVILFSGVNNAQAPAKDEFAEKQRQYLALADLALQEIPSLKLPENRAFVHARAGAMLWETDEKRARSLFASAVDDLQSAIQATPGYKKEKRNNQNELGIGQGLRHQILQIIAGASAELALEALYKSRPPIVAEAIAGDPGKRVKISQYSYGRNNYLAQAEMQLEQNFLRQAADQSPDRAATYLRESLTKGLTHQSVDLLWRLHQKDAALAREMTAEMMSKLTAARFIVNNQLDHQNFGIAYSLLSRYIQSRDTKEVFPTMQPGEMKAFAEKLVAVFSDTRVQQNVYYVRQAIEIADNLVPGASPRLKEIVRENAAKGNGDPNQEAVSKLLASETTPEQMIAEAKKFPLHARGQLYENAASKLAAAGNIAAARQLIEDNFSDHALDNALHNLNNREFYNLNGNGKFAEAERVIADLPEAQRLPMLINLANSVFGRNREENRGEASAILYRARGSVGDEPENAQEMGQMLQLISAFSEIEPASAFQMFESITPRINEIAEATTVINAFHNNGAVRHGEMMIAQSNSIGFHIDSSIFGRLAEKDFDRTMQVIDGLSRREMRLLFRLEIAQGSKFRSMMVDLPIITRSVIRGL